MQKGWSQKGIKATMQKEGEEAKREIADSKIKEKKSMQSVNTGFLMKEIDTEMKEANKTTKDRAESKHAIKELTEEEIKRIAKEIGLEEEKTED